jgi:carbamoyltransferase
MNILGIGGYSHDTAAVLVCDGQLVAGVAEERLTRKKHQGFVPRRAVQWCLDEAGLTRDDVDHVCCYMRPGLRMARRVPYRMLTFLRVPYYASAFIGYEFVHNINYVIGMRGLLGKKARIHFMEHHPAHAASAFLVSPYEEAALLTLDYMGEWAVTWSGVGRGTQMEHIQHENYPHSLGVFYTAMTAYLGFMRASDEYKVMGLASYGKPEYIDEFRTMFQLLPGGRYKLDLSWFHCHYKPGSRVGYVSPKFQKRFGPTRKKDEPIEERHQNIAASAQHVLEEVALHIAEDLHQRTGLRKLCMAGGVALNCAMNGRLLRDSPFEEIYVQPASGDDGTGLGAAFMLHHQLTGKGRSYVMNDARIGPSFASADIKEFLDLAKIPYETPESLVERTAELLAEGNIVGWFQGREEFGPRALGSRSILADPTRPDMQDLINKYVKHREEFRPFAPSCLEERAHEYFEGCTWSPFMLFVYPVKPAMRDKIPAVTHVDGTARVQTVSKATHPQYYALIEAFERRRGVPMVLNTSFNVMGEPIVNSPADAIRCFYSTGMDALAIGDFVVRKR